MPLHVDGNVGAAFRTLLTMAIRFEQKERMFRLLVPGGQDLLQEMAIIEVGMSNNSDSSHEVHAADRFY